MRHAGEFELLAITKGIANLDGAVIVQADDITGYCLLDHIALAGFKVYCVGNSYVLAEAHMAHFHAAMIVP